MNYKQRRLKSVLTAITIILAPFALILANATIVDSPAPFAYAQTWAEPPSAWMNVTGGNGALNWIFREGYYPSPFTVNIEVSGVTDLFVWEFKLSWNASLLDVTSVSEGSFLSDGVPGTTAFYSETIQDQAGLDYVLVNCTLLGAQGKAGSGVIAIVNFDLDAPAMAGSTPLDLYETKFKDRHMEIIRHGLTDGFAFMGDHNMYPLIYMLPQTIVAGPAEMFNVTIWIDNVESLQAWGFELRWTNYVLEAMDIVNHIFLQGDSFGLQDFDNGIQSKAWAAQVLAGSQEGTYGSGPLATITFMVEQAEDCLLHFDPDFTDLIGIYYNPPETAFTYPIDHATFNGLFQSGVGSTPHAYFEFWPFYIRVNDTITFNASRSFDLDGDIVAYSWNFGDGTTQTLADPIATHVYVTEGRYLVSLTVTDNDGLEDTTSYLLLVEPWLHPPYAGFSYLPWSPTTNQTVYFDASYSYDPDGFIVSYSWDFGDGTTQTLQSPTTTHVYVANGTYTVNLTVTDNDGLEGTDHAHLVVEPWQPPPPPQPSPPVAYFFTLPNSPIPNQTVTFDASYSYDPDGFITNYFWNFGDGTITLNQTSPVTTHVYSQHGTYPVTLTVMDNDGLADSTSMYLRTAAEIYIYPSTVEASPGDAFRIDIRIRNVRDLFGWQVSLSWDASILDFVNVTEGNFLKGIENNPTWFISKIYEDQVGNDSITVGCNRIGNVLGVDGDGLLASVLFRTTGPGSTILDLYDTILVDSRSTPFAIDHYSTDGYVISQGTPTHDVAITYVNVYPRQTTPGHIVGIEVEVQNQGTAGETFNVTAYYGDQIIGTARVWYLPRGTYQWLVFDWDTTGVAEGTYTIRLEADVVPGETDTADNTYVNGFVTIIAPKITIDPSSGPVGTKVTVRAHGLPTYAGLYLTFDDQLMGLIYTNETGEITAVFNVPLSEVGQHVVKVTVSYYMYPMILEAPFTVIDVAPLDVVVDVGNIFFKGETAEFHVQTVFEGTAVDATSLTAQLLKPDGTSQALMPSRIGTGLYSVEYVLAGKGSMTGTYTLLVEANYGTDTVSASGTSIKTFLVKPTWERELPKIAALSVTSIGLIGGMLVLWKREKKRFL